jgi:hypothetical protein
MNVDDGKKARAVLKSYFVKNAIPTEQQFAQLIDSVLNERDDGLVKVAGDPLAIEAAGDDTSFKKALNFYTKLSDNDPAWTISLRPRAVPADPQTGRAGLSINDAGGNSRLAIDAATGRIGIGVVAPSEALEIAGRAKAGALTIGAPDVNTNYGYVSGPGDLATNYALAIGISGPEMFRTVLNGKDIRFRINNTDRLSVTSVGNVGIGTQTPSEPLEVAGRIKVGALSIGPWPANPSQYVFFGSANLDQTQNGNYALLQGTSPADNGTTYLNSPLSVRLRIGNVDRLTVAQNGNIGIGTTAPTHPLEVTGNIKTGALLLGPWPPSGNYVCFGTTALDQGNAGNYALLQSSGGSDFGTTYLNSPT